MPTRLENILAAHGVEFRDGGRDDILVRCPLCGDADPSQHLAISTRKLGWRCFRNRQHKGRSYVKLLTLVLRCSEERARELLGIREAAPLPDADDFALQWRRQLGMGAEAPETGPLRFPKEFRKLTPRAKRSDAFWEYLTGRKKGQRHFTTDEAEWAADAYNLHFAISGDYAFRIIIPIYTARGELATWTARSLNPDADIRYMTLKKDFAKVPPGNLLLGLPLLRSASPARCLIVNEGPFDAIAVSALGHKLGVWGTCIFGLELSESQGDLLTEFGEYFDRMRLILDPGAMFRVLNLRSSLPRRCLPVQLPPGFDDPGELTQRREGEMFIHSLA